MTGGPAASCKTLVAISKMILKSLIIHLLIIYFSQEGVFAQDKIKIKSKLVKIDSISHYQYQLHFTKKSKIFKDVIFYCVKKYGDSLGITTLIGHKVIAIFNAGDTEILIRRAGGTDYYIDGIRVRPYTLSAIRRK